ncbi:MAG: NAD(P)-dependent alcohol dehydrogenase [Bacteroidetes bacterium]|nr:MAG: NAD(P)-dependent alcohol dehydrogenase [Bacteroidota bacterium]
MKAFVFTTYGSPEVLQLQDLSKPVPGEQEVLVKIHATAVNDYDWSMVRGKPYLYRLMYGVLKPKINIPGMELSGTVEALGENARTFEVGDAVFGDISEYGFGTYAEYVCIHEKALALKPAGMPHDEAATIPHASLLAYQGLIDLGQIQKGQDILINGAGGGVGTLGLQLAKLYDAQVTGVDTGAKLQMMQDMGFDHVIDYRKTDFTRTGRQYDLILDAKTTRSVFAYARALKPGGAYVTVGGAIRRLLQLFLLGPLVARLTKKQLRILALKPNKGLAQIIALYEAGKIKPAIDGPYAFDRMPELLQYFGEGKHQGKVVVRIT